MRRMFRIADAPARSPRVLVVARAAATLAAAIRAEHADLEVLAAEGPGCASAGLSRAPEVAFVIKARAAPEGAYLPLVAAESLRWLQVGGSGYEHLGRWDPARLTVTNAAGVLAPYLAETTMGALLALNGRLFTYRAYQAAHLWRPLPFTPLEGKTLLVVGLGEIGRRVAVHARGFGMRVIGVRRRAGLDPDADRVVALSGLRAALAEADAVSLHLRLAPQTAGLMDADAFAAMKPGALFLNTARGGLVDEAALVEALRSGRLGGAYLDVVAHEPLPSESPLWEAPNLFLTPHAADKVEGFERMFLDVFLANLDAWRSGRPLRRVVSPE